MIEDSILDIQIYTGARKVKLTLALFGTGILLAFSWVVSLFALTVRIRTNFMHNFNPPEINGREKEEVDQAQEEKEM